MKFAHRLFVTLWIMGGLATSHRQLGAQETASPSPAPADQVEFNRDIRPILSDKCFACHGPDKNKREADLRLDTADGLRGTGGEHSPVVPGKPDESELLRRLISSDPEQVMPPPKSGKVVSPAEVDLIRRWIAQGGTFEGHWAFLPLRYDPTAAAADDASAANTVDGLIDRGLAAANLGGQNLKPAPEADRATLLRRLSLDLVGLPPTPEEVATFVADSSPDAYAKQVDRILHSPHFGERMAMFWLDLVRYADSVGYHGDQEVSVSPYRQYVIDSFNANKKFDQFTLEQLAGDLLPNPTREQRIASGYNRLGMMSAEGGVQDQEYLAKYIAERVRNVSGAWLGITFGCAECHDHKFDPFTMRDFYSLEAFFADIQERGLYAGAHADGNWGASMPVPTPQQESALAELDGRIAATKKQLETPTAELAAAQEAWEKGQPQWTLLKPAGMRSQEGVTLAQREDGSILASGANPATDTYVLEFATLPAGVTALRLEVLPDDSLPKKGPGRAGNGNFVLSEITAQIKRAGAEPRVVAFQNPSATYEQTGAAADNPFKKWAIAAAIDGDNQGKKWGWAVMEKVGEPHAAVFETVADLTLSPDESLEVSLLQNLDNPHHTIGRFRVLVATSPRPVRVADAPAPKIAAILAVPVAERSEAQRQELAAHYRTLAPALAPVREELARLEKSRKELEATIPTSLVTQAVEPRTIRFLKRGNWMDKSGDVMTPALPGALPHLASGDRRLTRVDLAQWLTARDNPLTARVFANRVWKICFGAGLSRKLDDLGAQGEWPSHPALLDFLAGRFIETGWDVKRLVRTMVLSKTYRRSSVASSEWREVDPANRWLARQGRFRLDAELVRDNALSISGLLVPTLGGRSVRPYQPPGYWAHLNFPQREWQNSAGADLYRRGLYTHWQRQYLHPSLLAFDAPCREECTADRPRSNTPLQSLVLLNDATYVEAARAFAEMLLRTDGSNSERLNVAFLRATARPISPEEAAILEPFVASQQAEYERDPEAAKALLAVGSRPIPADLPPATLAAWTNTARAILNLHEVITRN